MSLNFTKWDYYMFVVGVPVAYVIALLSGLPFNSDMVFFYGIIVTLIAMGNSISDLRKDIAKIKKRGKGD